MTLKTRTLVGSSRVTSRGQITIPQEVRDKHEVKQGDIMYFIEVNGDIIIKKGPIQL